MKSVLHQRISALARKPSNGNAPEAPRATRRRQGVGFSLEIATPPERARTHSC